PAAPSPMRGTCGRGSGRRRRAALPSRSACCRRPRARSGCLAARRRSAGTAACALRRRGRAGRSWRAPTLLRGHLARWHAVRLAKRNEQGRAMNDSASGQPAVTAALLVIGDEILSGRTKDKNIGYIAEYLTAIGIDLKEVRVVSDDEDAIVDAVNALRHRHTYLFTTGGIGPTHHHNTSCSVPKAFGAGIDYDPSAPAIMRATSSEADLHEARKRMARVPDGADLVLNKVSKAPGFWIGNVIVMAGVPAIMQAMLDDVAPKLRTGTKMLSVSVRADAREGDIGTPLAEVAKAHPGTSIGSYPFFDDKRGPNTNVVVRSRDPAALAAAKAAVEEMLARVKAAL